ncbi:MAG: hypothetical protein IJ342_10190 [Muribaculaceae bacterium]|nr:hypothetical protein [Muribaculaceae bacterium]
MSTELIIAFVLAIVLYLLISFFHRIDKDIQYQRRAEVERRKRKARKLLGMDPDE